MMGAIDWFKSMTERLAGWMPCVASIGFAAALFGGGVLAEEATVEAVEEEVVALPAETLIRQATTRGIIQLRDRAREDYLGFFVPPISQRRVVDRREVEVRYRREIIERPIYEYETYRTVENVRVGDSAAGPTQLREVTRQRIKRQIGTETEERLIRDPNGDVVRTENHPVWGPGGPDLLEPGFYGENGMAIYACLVAGVPEDDAILSGASQIVTDFVDAYGLTDHTWDLAWLTVAMVNLSKNDPVRSELIGRMVDKLLMGQIAQGEGAGLWGPVCVNPTVLSTMLSYEMNLHQNEIARLRERHERSPNRRSYQEQYEQAKQTAERFHQQFRHISQQGLMFDRIQSTHHTQVKARPGSEGKLGIEVGLANLRGLPYFIYGEQIGDLENTSIALFAIKEAAAHGYLPPEVRMPVDVNGQPLLPAIATKTVLERAARRLNDAIQAHGTATENNTWQTIDTFDEIGILGLPYDPSRIGKLSSTMTFTSTAQAFASLFDLLDTDAQSAAGRMVQPGKMRISRTTTLDMAQALLAGDTKGVPVGGYVPPYDFIFELGRTLDSHTNLPTLDRMVWRQFADYLVGKQVEAGAWSQDDRKRLATFPSLVDYIQKDVDRHFKERREPFEEKDVRQRINGLASRSSRRINPALVSTAYATIFLAQGMRPPVAATWSWNDRPQRTATISQVVNRLSSENGIALRHSTVGANLGESTIDDIPLLMISGTGEFNPQAEGALSQLRLYLATGGCVVVESPANPAGAQFLAAVKEAVTRMLPEARESTMPPAIERMREVKVLKDDQGSIKAMFLSLRVPGSEDEEALEPWQAMQAIYQVLLGVLEPNYLSPKFALDWDMIAEHDAQKAAESDALFDFNQLAE